MDYRRLVDEAIAMLAASPVDILGIGDAMGEHRYLLGMAESYARTIADIDGLFAGDRNRKVLEIGSFLGVVSISLAGLGYRVHACDIPEFHQSEALQGLYDRHGIPFSAVNLRQYKLPYDSQSFDAIVVCEVMEHLNFNPLPVLSEFNRALKPGGYLYIGMPNQAALSKRLRLFLGKSCNNPIDDFFAQLDRKSNMVVGLHWREYTMAETVELVQRTGFDIARKYFYAKRGESLSRSLLKAAAYSIPSLRPFLVLVARKSSEPGHAFWLTEANG